MCCLLVVLGACQSLGAQYRDDVLLVKVVGRSVGLVPLSLALRRSGGTAVVPSGAHQRRGGAARAGSRPERRNPLHLNISKYPLQQGQNLRTPCSSRCCARLVLAPALSACRPLSPLSRPSLPTRQSPPFACQNPSTLPCSSLRCRKILPPEMTLSCFVEPMCPGLRKRGTPLPPSSETDVCLFHFCSGGSSGDARVECHGLEAAPEPGVVKSKGPAVVVGQLKKRAP